MTYFEKFKQQIPFIVSLIFATLFLYAAVTKILHYEEFSVSLAQSIEFGNTAVQIAWIIPFLEFVLSILLFFRKCTLHVLYACFGLILIFTLYILLILSFSDSIPCSCGGFISAMGWTAHVLFNVVLLVLAAVGILYSEKYVIKK